MKNITKTLSNALIIISASLAFSLNAHAAGYVKFDGVDGESKAQQPSSSQQQSAPKRLDAGSKPQKALLLPAVQKVREPARTNTPQKNETTTDHSAGTEHEIEYDIAN